jgi:hypothetical protein
MQNERTLYTSPGRTTFTLSGGTGACSFKLSSSAGVVIITNQRVPLPLLPSPSLPLQPTNTSQVIYLPTTRTSQLESFSAPILNLQDSRVSAPFFGPNYWTCTVQPVSGGNIPPSNTIVELKLVFKDAGAFDFSTTFERLKERVAQAVENSGSIAAALNNVHLEDLPAYEAPRAHNAPPPDAPPGYEEVQRESVERAARDIAAAAEKR